MIYPGAAPAIPQIFSPKDSFVLESLVPSNIHMGILTKRLICTRELGAIKYSHGQFCCDKLIRIYYASSGVIIDKHNPLNSFMQTQSFSHNIYVRHFPAHHQNLGQVESLQAIWKRKTSHSFCKAKDLSCYCRKNMQSLLRQCCVIFIRDHSQTLVRRAWCKKQQQQQQTNKETNIMKILWPPLQTSKNLGTPFFAMKFMGESIEKHVN